MMSGMLSGNSQSLGLIRERPPLKVFQRTLLDGEEDNDNGDHEDDEEDLKSSDGDEPKPKRIRADKGFESRDELHGVSEASLDFAPGKLNLEPNKLHSMPNECGEEAPLGKLSFGIFRFCWFCFCFQYISFIIIIQYLLFCYIFILTGLDPTDEEDAQPSNIVSSSHHYNSIVPEVQASIATGGGGPTDASLHALLAAHDANPRQINAMAQPGMPTFGDFGNNTGMASGPPGPFQTHIPPQMNMNYPGLAQFHQGVGTQLPLGVMGGMGGMFAPGMTPFINPNHQFTNASLNQMIMRQQVAGQMPQMGHHQFGVGGMPMAQHPHNMPRGYGGSSSSQGGLTPDILFARHGPPAMGMGGYSSFPRNSFLGMDVQMPRRDADGIPFDVPVILALPEDNLKLSTHQVLLRHQIEAFRATEQDMSTHMRGRNKPILQNQIGIRCRHCSHLPVGRRQKGATYFPNATLGLYQAAQNMSTTHMQCGLCSEMPFEIKQQFAHLISTKVASSGAGRPYWSRAAKKLGLIDTEDGIRFIRDLPTEKVKELEEQESA
jgi:hypothetical protein